MRSRALRERELPSRSVLSQTAFMSHETVYKLGSNSRSRARRLAGRFAFAVPVLLSVVVCPPSFGGDATPARAKGEGQGQVTIV
jgi:hypothetical protein